MATRVAIMGFGRMGRNIFRAIYDRDDIEIVAINDLAPPRAMEYLLRFDSRRGRFPDPIQVVDGVLYAKGLQIPISHDVEPGDTPWYDLGVDVVVEATGRYRTREHLQKHLDAGADRVFLTTPPRSEIDAVHFTGVSSGPLSREHRIISCGSSTGNAMALLLHVLDGAFGVEEGLFTSVHAYTAEQSLIDVPSTVDLRLSRAAVENIVPLQSWTSKAMVRLFPHLEGKFGGTKLNVPVPDASCIDLVATVPREVTTTEINEVFRSASGSTLKGLLDFTDQPIVSSDVAGSTFSCTFDSQATMVTDGTMIKVLGWYDQGGGLSHRIVELIGQLGRGRN